MTLSRFGLIGGVVLFWAVWAVAGEQPGDRFEKVVRPMVQALNAEDYPRMSQDFGKVMSDALPPEKCTPFFKGVRDQCGKIEKFDPPQLTPPDKALFVAHMERAVLDIKVVLDERDKIVGLWILPHVPAIPAPERNSTVLRLPLEGAWLVGWGGNTRELNQHHDSPNQRYAFDFLVADSSGKTHRGDGTRKEAYFAFGRPVLAPADGVVTDVITGVRDNAPGSMNPFSALGNAVIIEHREHEVSVLAHFKQGSIRVKPGDRVTRGQVLGLCGNSGNSSEPHVHFHLQNTPIIQDGTGIQCFFDKVNVTRDGKSEAKADYSPIKGDIVSEP